MKTKEEILSLLKSLQGIVNSDRLKEITDYIESFNPYKIDEERMISLCPKDRFAVVKEEVNRYVKDAIKEYNSTAKEGLKPLPDEMPEWFGTLVRATTIQFAWKELVSSYGTPPRQELPSVEELGETICKMWDDNKSFLDIAQHLVNKYKLPTQNREWLNEPNMETPTTTITTKRSPGDIVYVLHKNKIRQATIHSVNVTMKHRPDLFTQEQTKLQVIESYTSVIKTITPNGIVNNEHAFTSEDETFTTPEQLITALAEENKMFLKID